MSDDTVAGAALDAEVARQVFGLVSCGEWERRNFGSAGGPVLMKRCSHEACYPSLEIGSIHGRIGGCPRYSTDIGAAWLVVDRLLVDGFTFEMRDRDGRTHESVWEVEFDPITVRRGGWGQADTPALAICRAALCALRPAADDSDRRAP